MADDNNNKDTHGNKPSKFDGFDWESFIYQVVLYIYANPTRFSRDADKIIFTLSYMTKGPARSWADQTRKEAVFDSATQKLRTTPVFGTWEVFLETADKRFADPNAQSKANHELQELHQGNKSAQEFFQKFEELSVRAGQTGAAYDEHRVNLLKVHLQEYLVTEIVKMVPKKKTYAEWRELVIEIDENLQANRAARQGQPTLRFPPRFQPPNRPPPRPQAQNQSAASMPGTYSGQGKGLAPMEGLSISQRRERGLCYRCGQPGHMARDCKEGRQRIRELVASLEPEDKFDLAEFVASLPESEFDKPQVERKTLYDPDSSSDSSFPKTEQ